MHKRIEGKSYNTDTAKELARVDSGHYPTDFEYWEETLYRTKSGNYFLHGQGGAKSKYGEWRGNNGGDGEKIIPIHSETALKWAETNLDGDRVDEIFGEIDEDKVKISADLSKSANAVLAELKLKTKRSSGEIISDLLLACSKDQK